MGDTTFSHPQNLQMLNSAPRSLSPTKGDKDQTLRSLPWPNITSLSFTIQLRISLIQSCTWKIWPEHAEGNNKTGLAMVKLKQIFDVNVDFQ